jgi:hypothetical protein
MPHRGIISVKRSKVFTIRNCIKAHVFVYILCISTNSLSQQNAYPFQNPSLSFEERVNDLVTRLTLEEKVGQMLNSAPAIPRLGIPAYDWWNEVLHGVARSPYRVTSFPQAIAMAATFDTNSLINGQLCCPRRESHFNKANQQEELASDMWD